jgi:hypothetical protein
VKVRRSRTSVPESPARTTVKVRSTRTSVPVSQTRTNGPPGPVDCRVHQDFGPGELDMKQRSIA